jgi:hypothetical protein
MSGVKSNTLGDRNEDFVENLQNTDMYTHGDGTAVLSQEHSQYLLDRHGTLDLDPVPGPGDADPYNWPTWKVCER